jgi:flagellar basal body P-ring formation protein FlgA
MIKFLILLFPFSCFAGLQPELTFSSATEVSPRTEITIYDIVEARNGNDQLIAQMKSLKIADGKSVRIEKNELAKALRHLQAKFILPSEIKIVRSRNEVSRMEVERKIKNHLQVGCFDCDLQIQISSVPSNLASDWDLDLNVDLTKNSAMIPIFSNSQPEKKGWVVAQIKRYQKVPVLNHAVKMGDVLTKDMFAFEKRLLQNSRETVLKIEAIEGMQASRFISAGQVLTYADLKKETVVKRGQIVKVLAGTKAIEVSMSGQVEETGAIGDIVRVKNIDSQKVFAARVIDRGVVRIE